MIINSSNLDAPTDGALLSLDYVGLHALSLIHACSSSYFESKTGPELSKHAEEPNLMTSWNHFRFQGALNYENVFDICWLYLILLWWAQYTNIRAVVNTIKVRRFSVKLTRFPVWDQVIKIRTHLVLNMNISEMIQWLINTFTAHLQAWTSSNIWMF